GRDDREVPARRPDPGRLLRRRPHCRHQQDHQPGLAAAGPRAHRRAAGGRRQAQGRAAAARRHRPGVRGRHPDPHRRDPAPQPALHQGRDALTAGDLPPFAAGIAAGAGLVMSGHLDVQAVDPGVPASFSAKVLVDLLRGQLGFKGVVVTDALDMAPAERWPPGEAAVRAIVAGNDLLLMPPDLAAAQRGLLDALHKGTLPRARLVEAATRVVTLKQRMSGAAQPELSSLDTSNDRLAASTVAAGAVTVLRGSCQGPYVRGPVRVVASSRWNQQRTWLADTLAAAGVQVTDTGGTAVALVGYGDTAVPPATVAVAMDLPQILHGANARVLLATYSSVQASMTALAKVLAGKEPAPGRSPVAVAGLPRSVCG